MSMPNPQAMGHSTSRTNSAQTDVEHHDQVAEREQRRRPEPSHRERDGAEGANRRDIHGERDHLEEHLRHGVDGIDHRLALRTEGQQREGEHHGEEQHWQHVALRERADRARRDQAEEELAVADRPRLLLHARGVAVRQRGGVDVHADPRGPGVDQHEAQHQRDRRHDLEVDERLDGHAPDALRLADARDSMDDGAEDDRRHDHAHEPDEQVAERPERVGVLRPQIPDESAQQHRHQDLEGQILVERTSRGGRSPATRQSSWSLSFRRLRPGCARASANSSSAVGRREIRPC